MSILFRDTCRSVRDKLPLHVGRDLDPKFEKQVDAHLATCLNCLREYRALAEARAILGVVAEQRLPEGVLDGFTEEVMARIAVDEPGPAAELPRSARRRTPLQLLPALSAAAALLLVALAAQLYFEREHSVARPDLGGLLQQHSPESRASDGGATSPSSARRTAPSFFEPDIPPGQQRFVFPLSESTLQLPPEPGEEAVLPTEAERLVNEALRRGSAPFVIKLGGLKTVPDSDPRPRDG